MALCGIKYLLKVKLNLINFKVNCSYQLKFKFLFGLCSTRAVAKQVIFVGRVTLKRAGVNLFHCILEIFHAAVGVCHNLIEN